MNVLGILVIFVILAFYAYFLGAVAVWLFYKFFGDKSGSENEPKQETK